MCLSTEPKFIKGVWGPYFGAIIDDYWLNEAGQSATGKLIDHIIESHPAYETLNEKISKRYCQVLSIIFVLNLLNFRYNNNRIGK